MLQHYTWDTNSIARAHVYLSALDMLSTSAQERYPYHVKKGVQIVVYDVLAMSDIIQNTRV